MSIKSHERRRIARLQRQIQQRSRDVQVAVTNLRGGRSLKRLLNKTSGAGPAGSVEDRFANSPPVFRPAELEKRGRRLDCRARAVLGLIEAIENPCGRGGSGQGRVQVPPAAKNARSLPKYLGSE